MKTLKINSYLLLIFILLQSTGAYSQKQEIIQEIQERIESDFANGKIKVGNKLLYSETGLLNFYKNHNYELQWYAKENREELIEILEDSFDEGLIPEDYHLEKIRELEKKAEDGNRDIDLLTDLELLLSDAAILYAHHLIWGKVDQSKFREEWDLPENSKPKNIDSLFIKYKYDNNLTALYDRLKPQHFMYVHLKKGLKHYRNIAENGAWTKIPEGETLKKGMTDESIAIMRTYLKITGDLSVKYLPENPDLFDDELEKAVKSFQFRHNLIQDGVVGKGTLAQMNISVEERIDILRVNMERGRWVMHQLEPDFLVVNIAGFNVRRVTHDSTVYFSPVIVGRKYHESPVFKAKMTYIEMNPTWTLPYSIATKETLPKLSKNPNYLAEKNMIIMDRNGKVLDPSTIDFTKYSKNNFPFTIRQKAGPHNALGEVKFMFPNKYSVYLHDTPGRSLFSREERAFSHGCIRLQKKWELLMNLMDEPEVWNMNKINEIVKTQKTTRITLPKPIDIILLYWTAGADKEDRLFFNKDVYDRDRDVLNALNEPIKFGQATN